MVTPAANERWQDLFWEHAPRAAAPRMQSTATVQSDLFGWLAPEAPARTRTEQHATETKKGVESPRSRAASLEKPTPASSVRKLRMAAAPARYADRRRTVNHEEVARLLEVTRGVLGVERAPEFALPRGRFAAQVEMWKGRPVGTPFVMERRAR